VYHCFLPKIKGEMGQKRIFVKDAQGAKRRFCAEVLGVVGEFFGKKT
jgi:hypothetical protein